MNISRRGYAPARDRFSAQSATALAIAALYCATAGRASSATLAVADGRADLVLRRGAVYTVDASRRWVSTIAIRGGRLAYLGDEVGVAAWIGPDTAVVDLEGRMVLPGFQDGHVHLLAGGLELESCLLSGATTAAEAVARVAACAAESAAAAASGTLTGTLTAAAQASGTVTAGAQASGTWLVGSGWALPLFAGGNPDRRALDEVVPDRPVFLWAADGHSAWVNSRALELAGLTAASPDPPGGRIERDPATGEPTGTLRESAADQVARLLPVPSAAAREAALARAVALAHRAGITGILEATADAESLAAFLALDRRGELDLQVAVAGTLDPEQPLEPQVERLERLRGQLSSSRVRLLAGKLFVDGVVESGTAALLSPYLDPSSAEPVDSRGELLWTEPELLEALLALDRAGLELHAHVIGDRAVRATLDAIQATARQRGARDRRPTLSHVQLVEPSDLPRFRALGAIAAVQPLWAYADSYIRDLTEPVLGPARSRWLYPLASLARSGAVVAAGSDWSVSSIEPLDGIEVALTRRAPEETSASAGASDSPPAWIPEERVDLETMLAAYTIRAAYASFRESTTGSLELGKSADLVVLDRNLFAIPPADISESEVLWALFEGREVWRHPDFDPTPLAPAVPDVPAPPPTARRAEPMRHDVAPSGSDSRDKAETSIEGNGLGSAAAGRHVDLPPETTGVRAASGRPQRGRSIGRSACCRRIGGTSRATRFDRATGVPARRIVPSMEAFRSSSRSRLEQECLVSVSRRTGGT